MPKEGALGIVAPGQGEVQFFAAGVDLQLKILLSAAHTIKVAGLQAQYVFMLRRLV
jgi:hypothetical protein